MYFDNFNRRGTPKALKINRVVELPWKLMQETWLDLVRALGAILAAPGAASLQLAWVGLAVCGAMRGLPCARRRRELYKYEFCFSAATRVKGKGFCEGFHPISSLELRRSSLRLFLVFGTHIFYLVIIIVEISWSQEEIWGKGRIRNNSNSYNPLWESHCWTSL
jgi:hypothetical protein